MYHTKSLCMDQEMKHEKRKKKTHNIELITSKFNLTSLLYHVWYMIFLGKCLNFPLSLSEHIVDIVYNMKIFIYVLHYSCNNCYFQEQSVDFFELMKLSVYKMSEF